MIGVVTLLAALGGVLLGLVLGAVAATRRHRRTVAARSDAPTRVDADHPALERPVAFVLSGGAAGAAVQAGMVRELLARGVVPQRLYGTSAGALNAAALANDPSVEGAERLCAIWRGLTREHIFPGRRAATTLNAFRRRDGMYSPVGLRDLIARTLDYGDLADSPVPLTVVATSLRTGSPRRLTRGPAVAAILASASIPGVFPPVVVEGEPLVDGSLVDHVPLAAAVEDGALDVYVLLAGARTHRPVTVARPYEAILAALSISMHARFTVEVDYLARLHPAARIAVIAAETPHHAFDDFTDPEDLIEAGARAVARYLDATPPSPERLSATDDLAALLAVEERRVPRRRARAR